MGQMVKFSTELTQADMMGPRPISTYDWDKPEERVAAFRAYTNSDFLASAVLGQPIPLEHWLCHRVTVANEETGEIEERTRVVMVDRDGRRVATSSMTVLRALTQLPFFVGREYPFRPAVLVVLKKKDMPPPAKSFLYLDLIDEEG